MADEKKRETPDAGKARAPFRIRLSSLNEAWLHVLRHRTGRKRLTKAEQDALLAPEVDLETGKLLHDPRSARAALTGKPKKPSS